MKIVAVSFCLLLLVAGCQSQSSAQSSTPPSEMAGRLNAALEIDDETARLNAVIKVAEDSAEAGDGEVVLQAISEIKEGVARDNVCATCSIHLAKSGNTSDATRVARQIKDETRRLNVLNSIANGSND